MYYLLLLALLASVSADTCPVGVEPVDNFNFASYASGVWYEVARYPNPFEDGYNCGSATYSRKGSLFSVDYNFVKDQEPIKDHGTVKVAVKGSNKGVVIQTLPLGAHGALQEYSLNILAIEYDKYMICYYCKDGGEGLAWIYSREKSLSAYSKAEVDKFLKKSTVLDADLFMKPKFDAESCRIELKGALNETVA